MAYLDENGLQHFKEKLNPSLLSDDAKQALLQIASKVAYIDEHGQDYYDNLYDALYPEVPATAISLNYNSLTFSEFNQTQQLVATLAPADATDSVSWTSSDSSVASVSSSGLVTSKANGSATITATAGSVSTTCSVTVTQATVSSISAVYTQSGTVYDTDSLDSLRDDLVVTATYSDSSTATVPSADYTLSGTLTVGTSTITVTYSGKTTTFTVTVTDSSALPTGYTKYDYLYCGAIANNRGSYIITDLTFSYTSEVKFIADATMDSGMTWMGILVGCRQTGTTASQNNMGAYIACNPTDSNIVIWADAGSTTGYTPTSMTDKHRVVGTITPSALTIAVDDNPSVTGNYTPRAIGGHPICLFGVTRADSTTGGTPYTFRGKMYYAEVQADGVVLAKYYPCVRDSDSAPGVYDTVNQTFYTYTLSGNGNPAITAGNDE